MAQDYMRYDLMAQDALRTIMRQAFAKVQDEGLRGAHYFEIVFATGYPGVELSEVLRAQYPGDMKIVIQHQFWDLQATDDTVAVTLSFNKMPERIVIPYKAVRAFLDPGVKFGLEFQVEGFSNPRGPRAVGEDEAEALGPTETPEILSPPKDEDAKAEDAAAKPAETGEVVSLDAFRKK